MTGDLRDKIAATVVDLWLGNLIDCFGGVPGIQVCVRKDGDILLNKAYGIANVETGEALTTDHIFHVGSQSKMLTSCAIHILQERGALSLEDKLVDHLPELTSHSDERFKEITLRHLVEHKSGIFRDGTTPGFWQYDRPFPSKEEVVQQVLSKELAYAPGETEKYSNFGYALLGLVIEKASGRSYEEFIKDEISSPLGVPLYTDYVRDSSIRFAEGHSRGASRMPLRHSSANGLAAATGGCATAESASLFGHEYYFGNKLISASIQKQVCAQLARWDCGSPHLVGHFGAYQGNSSGTLGGTLEEAKYVASYNANNEKASFPIHGVLGLFKLVKETFNESEARKVVVSKPLYNLGAGYVFVVGATKALCIPIETTSPNSEAATAIKTNKGFFVEGASKYASRGEEAFRVVKTENGVIKEVFYEGSAFLPRHEFLKRAQTNAFQIA